MKRILAIAHKEMIHVLRDPTSLVIILALPIIMMFLYGYSINYDMNNINCGIIDYSKSKASRDLIKRIDSNKYYTAQIFESGEETLCEELLLKGKLHEYIIIPKNFSQKLSDKRIPEVFSTIDGSNSNIATLIYQYNDKLINNFNSGFLNRKSPVKITTSVLFNPELESSFFFIPGLIAILLIMVSALMTSLSIAKEKDRGSLDLLFISPLKSIEIIVGKTLPYIIITLLIEALILITATFWFNIPLKGDLLVLLVYSLIYIFTSLAFGILISTTSSDQKTAMFKALIMTMIPSMFLSGFIFPIESQLPAIQMVSRFIPATYFLKIIRGVVVKGSKVSHFAQEGVILCVFGIVLVLAATVKFEQSRRKRS